eukprot:10008032-Ditylum_brightwellii.AAC.1
MKYGGLKIAHFWLNMAISTLKFDRTHSGRISDWKSFIITSESGTTCKWKQDTISQGDAWTPSLQQDCDVMLMDAYETDKPSTNTLDHLNRMQL